MDWVIHSSLIIGGPGKTVEIDESKFGRRKYNRGHRVEGQYTGGQNDKAPQHFWE